MSVVLRTGTRDIDDFDEPPEQEGEIDPGGGVPDDLPDDGGTDTPPDDERTPAERAIDAKRRALDGVTVHEQSNFAASRELAEFRLWLDGVRVFETTRPRTLTGDERHTFAYPS